MLSVEVCEHLVGVVVKGFFFCFDAGFVDLGSGLRRILWPLGLVLVYGFYARLLGLNPHLHSHI